MPILATYEPVCDGTKTLLDLEAEGVNTALVKQLKVRHELDNVGYVVAVTRGA